MSNMEYLRVMNIMTIENLGKATVKVKHTYCFSIYI